MFAAFLDAIVPSRRRRRAVAAAIWAAQLEQQYEYRAAQRRIFDQATGLDAHRHNQRDPGYDGVGWDGPTRHLLVAPLLTPGQVARSRRDGRW